jgi:hypothetical protein
MTVLKMPNTTNPGHDLLASALASLDRAAEAIGLDPAMRAYECPLREAAFIVALERVAGAISKRGIFP